MKQAVPMRRGRPVPLYDDIPPGARESPGGRQAHRGLEAPCKRNQQDQSFQPVKRGIAVSILPQFSPTADRWNVVVPTPGQPDQLWPVVGWIVEADTLLPVVWFYGVRKVADALSKAGLTEFGLERV